MQRPLKKHTKSSKVMKTPERNNPILFHLIKNLFLLFFWHTLPKYSKNANYTPSIKFAVTRTVQSVQSYLAFVKHWSISLFHNYHQGSNSKAHSENIPFVVSAVHWLCWRASQKATGSTGSTATSDVSTGRRATYTAIPKYNAIQILYVLFVLYVYVYTV